MLPRINKGFMHGLCLGRPNSSTLFRTGLKRAQDVAIEPIQAVRGMKDVLPDQVMVWQKVEKVLREVFAAYDYQEIRLPLIEKTELFSRTIGEETDIVAKEMYTFADRNGDNLTLRPEGTAGCVRAGIEHGLFHRRQQRVWYMGPMFRHERPQRGRYRQFHQAGVEAFGLTGPDIDVELIAMCARIFSALGVPEPELQLNSLATPQSRIVYRQQLVSYLSTYKSHLDPDSQNRLQTNPLRILDSKNPKTQEILSGAPDIRDTWDAESRQHFDELCGALRKLRIRFTVNPRLVRGLDYYNRTVFEWVSPDLGAQGSVCAGGRYDGLAQQLGYKQAVPAAGFALGLERMVEMVVKNGFTESGTLDVYMAMSGEGTRELGMQLAEQLRDEGRTVQWHCGDDSLKSQLKRADKSGAILALIIGDAELASKSVTVKSLRTDREQVTVLASEISEHMAEYFGH